MNETQVEMESIEQFGFVEDPLRREHDSLMRVLTDISKSIEEIKKDLADIKSYIQSEADAADAELDELVDYIKEGRLLMGDV